MSFTNQIIREFGVSGLIRSSIHSIKETKRPAKLLFAPEVDVIYNGTYLYDIETRFIMRGPGRGRFEMEDGGVLRVRNGPFQIGRGSDVEIGGTLELGDSYIKKNALIKCKNHISIGDGCAISWNVTLLDDDRHTLILDGERRDPSGKIKIKDNVWIGHNVTIKKDVTIGESAVVASNSVVTSDVPPNVLVAGVPAKIKRRNVTWEP